MIYDLQKASSMKRFSAWLLDAILFCVLMTGCLWAVSNVIGLNHYTGELNAHYERYEAEYGISFDDREAYNAMTEEEKQAYDATVAAAEEAMVNDEAFMASFHMVIQMLLIVLCISIFLAKLILEFFIPLWLRNGQTVGKKAFGLAVMRTNSVRISGVNLFIRSILGKYTTETMVPVFILIMSFTGVLGMTGIILLLVMLLIQIVLMITSPTNAMIHDKFADTVVVDMHSQLIFESAQARLEYQQRIAAEKAQSTSRKGQ